MRTLALLLLALALLVAACGESDAATTTTTVAAGDNTLETLPPTSTVAPPETTTTINPIAEEYGLPTVTGTPLPAFASGTDPAIGIEAPVTVGTDYDGTAVTVGGGGGATQAVLFVAHWCSHCQNELPEIVRWLDETGGVDGVDLALVTVAVDPNRDNFPPSAWIEREGWTGPVLRDDADNTAFFAYGGSQIPFWVFINPDGTVAARVSGGIGGDQLESILDEISARS